MKIKKLRRYIIGIWGLLLCSGICGCASSSEAVESSIVIESNKSDLEISLATALISDIEKSCKIKCVYQQVNDENVSFRVSGRLIGKVYVKEGDPVQKGQKLAELRSGTWEEDVSTLEYRMKRNELLKEQAQENMNYDISTRWIEYYSQPAQSDSAKKNVEEAVVEIQKTYKYMVEDCEDAILTDTMQLEKVMEEIRQSTVYAGMSGTVSYVKEELAGGTSKEGDTIITIIDSSECIFSSDMIEYSDFFTEEMEVKMEISTGSAAGQYTIIPYKINLWADNMLFILSDKEESTVIDVGTDGTIILILDRREQVLNVPLASVHSGDGDYYVYVLGENDIREVKWITVGLLGDDKVEVTSGLREGDKVILR